MESSHRGFASTVEVLSAKMTAGPPSGGGDGFAREASAGTSDRPGRRACGRTRGRWSVRLEVEADVGGSGPAGRPSSSTPAGARGCGGFDGYCADVGARAPEGRGERVNAVRRTFRPVRGPLRPRRAFRGSCPTGAVAPCAPAPEPLLARSPPRPGSRLPDFRLVPAHGAQHPVGNVQPSRGRR